MSVGKVFWQALFYYISCVRVCVCVSVSLLRQWRYRVTICWSGTFNRLEPVLLLYCVILSLNRVHLPTTIVTLYIRHIPSKAPSPFVCSSESFSARLSPRSSPDPRYVIWLPRLEWKHEIGVECEGWEGYTFERMLTWPCREGEEIRMRGPFILP